jgi:hypothetical protein
MDQFNRDTYKKETLFQEFYHSCLGKIIILAVILLILFVVGVMTVPSDKMVVRETMDNIHQCLQDNDSINNDELDEDFANISRTFSEADTTLTNPELLKYFRAYNTIAVYDHTAYKTAYLHNTRHPQGVRVGIAIFGKVISTVYYDDMVLDLGPARGDFNERLVPAPAQDEYFGDNPHLKPYHYKGNPED